VGVVGYYQAQTTTDSGPGSDDGKDSTVAVGPEFNAFFPKLGCSLRRGISTSSNPTTGPKATRST
jgi:hypothetical protein